MKNELSNEFEAAYIAHMDKLEKLEEEKELQELFASAED